MQKNKLLIVGAGVYGVLAAEIAADMNCFDQIDFVDDGRTVAVNGKPVIGTVHGLETLCNRYDSIVVAIGNADCRLSLLERFEKELPYKIVSLISPYAYISPSAQLGSGCIVEPMAVIHTGCVISLGSFISAGAVVNHYSVCGRCVHIDCNATVEGNCMVPEKCKVHSGEVYRRQPR